MKTISLYYLRLPAVARLFIIVIAVLFIFGTIIHLLEPNNITSIFNGIYWAIVTISTIGYGDFVPKTVPGKLVTILMVFLGTTFITYLFSQAATYTIKRQSRLVKGNVNFTDEGHVIVIGWNERSKVFIDQLQIDQPGLDIVLVDRTLNKNPTRNGNVHFINGKPYEDATLMKANVRSAHYVIITANSELSEEQADMDSILTLVALKGCSPLVKVIVEIKTETHYENAKRAGADTIVQSSRIIGSTFLEKLD
ncbi:potassium channel family protein [Alkalihalobacillus sp. AL-G]|uniref:potassium channel family protein n=1 Tax=Alkalihalobacillus sp. AL-G TaxID=2926399 RepID=UPI00272C5634|nr:potassium channel family protein [Alkalihalobacillus sp. AL-G]WLD92659.1 ion channel [Alkalihalobacillus sp. AL-G]